MSENNRTSKRIHPNNNNNELLSPSSKQLLGACFLARHSALASSSRQSGADALAVAPSCSPRPAFHLAPPCEWQSLASPPATWP